MAASVTEWRPGRVDSAAGLSFCGDGGQTVAAHIRMSVDAGGREQTIDDIHFLGDPLLTTSMRGRMVVDGPFSTLCRPERDASGARRCTRNIRLGP